MVNLDTLVLAVAAILFVTALGALSVWAFRTFFGRQSTAGFRPREKRLGVVEWATVDAKRKLLLVRRDDTEILVMTGGPVDVVLETGIKGRPHLEPPLEDVTSPRPRRAPLPISAKNELD